MIGICGFGVVIIGLAGFLLSRLFRVTGKSLTGLLTFFLQNRKEKEPEPTIVAPPPRPNLRSLADAQDFDSALAKQIVQGKGIVPNSLIQAQSRPRTAPPPPGFEDVSSKLKSSQQRIDEMQRKKRSNDDADIFGALLDDDGDVGF
jgi:hypothetical protein